MIRVRSTGMMMDWERFLNSRPMKGRNLGIVSRSGGHGVIAADTAEYFDFNLPPFPQKEIQLIKQHVRGGVINLRNPLDLGDLFDLSIYEEIAPVLQAERTVVDPRTRRPRTHRGPGGIRFQVGEMAPADCDHQPVSRQRHVCRGQQRHRQSLEDMGRDAFDSQESEAGAADPDNRLCPVGISGLRKVQVWVHNKEEPLPAAEEYFANAPWRDAEILSPPDKWGGGLANDKIPAGTLGFEAGRPVQWPLRLTKVHWAALLPGLPAGQYIARSRTIDAKGYAQPMPRPFRKSGHAAIEQVPFDVES